MLLRVNNIALWLDEPETELAGKVAQKLGMNRSDIAAIRVLRSVLDARKKGSPRYIFSLEVELAAFEEVPGPPDRVRLRAFYTLHDDRLGLLQESLTLEQPVPPGPEAERPRAVAEAFGRVLHAAVAQVADRVVVRLSAPGVAAR